jgi:hypothetical protein
MIATLTTTTYSVLVVLSKTQYTFLTWKVLPAWRVLSSKFARPFIDCDNRWRLGITSAEGRRAPNGATMGNVKDGWYVCVNGTSEDHANFARFLTDIVGKAAPRGQWGKVAKQFAAAAEAGVETVPPRRGWEAVAARYSEAAA